MRYIRLRYIICLLLFLLLLPGKADSASGQAMIEPHAQAMPLMPFLDYLIDQSMGMDIEEAAAATGWQPFIPDNLPEQEGVIWLRFTIAPLAPDARPQTFLLDMGESVPGTAVLFEPFRNELSGAQEWRENVPAQRNILLLPEAASEAIPCYIRMDGLPGPWFDPMIRTPQNAASNLGSLAQNGAILALAVVMFICLLRGASEKGQWRFWTAMFVAVALLQAFLGMPAAGETFSITGIAAVMSPGLALMLLPHVGRHLMQARKYSRSIDIQLFLLAFPGAALAILPLVPGWSWLYRWLDLWPLGTALYIPTALGAWMVGIPGSRRFLLACVIPPVFTGFALLGLEFGLPANILASCPTWGVALSALLLAATRSPVTAEAAAPPAKKQKAAEPEKPTLPQLELAPSGEAINEEVITLEHPLDDPNLRLIMPKREKQAEHAPRLAPPQSEQAQQPESRFMEVCENAMREPLDSLLRDAAALARCSLPASARQYAENMVASARQLGGMLAGNPECAVPQPAAQAIEESFNLQRILRNVHDSVAGAAESAGIALSWYMPPHMAQLYCGNARSLENTLTMLLESSVRSAHHGAIKVAAKRVPDSSDPGHLLFTVTDDGNGYPPLDRSSLALVRAWELTGEYGGYLSVECSQHGATIAFTAHFAPVEEEIAESASENGASIILVGDDRETRRQLARILETVPCNLVEVANGPEVAARQTQKPASLIIFSGRFARPAMADLVRELDRIARQAGEKCPMLAITADESEWPLLKASGFTHAMLEPVDPEVLRRTVMDLTESPAERPDAPYYEAAATLAPEPVQKEMAPSMIIDQSFPGSHVFEGPDWLGEPEEPGAEPPKQEQAEPEKPAKQEAPARLAPEESSAPQSAVEWVGEPMPVGTPPVRHEKPATPEKKAQEAAPAAQPRVAQVSHAPEAATEWVGEPEPVKKQEKPEQVEGELLDYIVGVKEEGGKGSSVREFVEGSVNMVTSTVSNILRKKEQPEEPAAAPEEEPIKARSDPAIISLLERMDVAMRHANAAFAIKNGPAIAQSTGMIASDAEKFGLRLLARMAKCVERAALANDMSALSDLLPELGIAVERNRITLAQRRPGKQ